MRLIEFNKMKNTIVLLLLLACVSCSYFKPKDSDTSEEVQEELHSNPDSTKYRLKVQGKVIEITDGDTFKLLNDKQEQVKIRLHEIDAPETDENQRYSAQARTALSDLIHGKTVFVYHKIGIRGNSWNRTIGVVFLDSLNINREMVRLGYAWHSKKHCYGYTLDSLEMDSIETAARINKRGLWHDDNPVPPWIKRDEEKD